MQKRDLRDGEDDKGDVKPGEVKKHCLNIYEAHELI